MATFNNTSPTPLNPTQVSVLDFLVPGSTGILAAIEPVLATNSSARPLLLCMLLVFLGRHLQRSMSDLLAKCTTWLVSGRPLNHSLTKLGHPLPESAGDGQSSSREMGCRRNLCTTPLGRGRLLHLQQASVLVPLCGGKTLARLGVHRPAKPEFSRRVCRARLSLLGCLRQRKYPVDGISTSVDSHVVKESW
ncbi:hypothetical protein C7999DRAFT_18239 [Corynascus novoguineensis]|uniref:Uncharacterized protein n=1 Tax=Corynascus novoguineensis TaxID=1126955 RepID=A0AAN7CKD9_9PEZI|nr:hypothetical protein C7999DRAFT_18239 [Corynascus novoguineensis]